MSSSESFSTVATAVAEALGRIDDGEPRWHALVEESGRQARLEGEASRLDALEGAARGPLHGALVAVKDVFHVDGLPTGGGSRLPPEVLAGPEATSVTRLRKAGALVLAKAVSTEFAYYAPGPTHNPRRSGHTPGGSSSGSAAAVAAGYCPLALGTQTIGSVTRPASFCGVVGYKPSYDRIPIDGVIPLAPSFDHVGVLAESVGWAERAAAVLCDDWNPSSAVARRPVLAVAAGPLLGRAAPTTVAQFEQVVGRLEGQGFEVRRVELLDAEALDRLEADHRRILAAEVAEVHARWLGEYRDLYHPTTLALIDEGRALDGAVLDAARESPLRTRRRFLEAMDAEGIDLWLSPSAPGPAPAGLDSTGDPVMNRPWSHAGLPTLGLPAAIDAATGLPLGLQVAGRFGHDESLLCWGHRLVEALAAG